MSAAAPWDDAGPLGGTGPLPVKGKRVVASLEDLPAAMAYLRRIGAEPRSLRRAAVTERGGRYRKEVAAIAFEPDGTVRVPEAWKPTPAEQAMIQREWEVAQWPHSVPGNGLDNAPDALKQAPAESLYRFQSPEGGTLFIQQRVEREGGKGYLPWSFWDDGRWRQTEPDGPLPLWGLDAVEGNTTAFVHEGPKAARAVRDMLAARTPETKDKLAAHPWRDELAASAHVGWAGGARAAGRTDWNALRKLGIERLYVVSDNDPEGVAAVPEISRRTGLSCYHLQFTDEWPGGFDLADPFPESMFSMLEGQRRYTGPTFRSCLHPATWATEMVPAPDGKGKPVARLRESFREEWAYVEDADLFVCKRMPDILRNEKILNKMLAPFSHVTETSRLIVRAYRGRTTRLCYRPDVEARVVTDRETSAVNLHVPSDIKPTDGSPRPWLDFMEYLVPDPAERKHLLRWTATLIARPDIRMAYGVLLVSEHQGVGKTTLGTSVLAPLVGLQNTGYPSENDISQSDFNGWAAQKRLVVVNEIYSGHSWKAYNRLKSLITDTEIQINEKYQRTYVIENWLHILACSNSLRALKVEKDDRRWFYPRLTEESWPLDRFREFRRWLASGGLGIIRRWADEWTDHVPAGARAPMTDRKRELIAESASEGQQEAAALAEAMAEAARPVVLAMRDVVDHVRRAVQGRMFDSDYEIRKAMVEGGGVAVWEERVKVDGRLQYLLCNAAALRAVDRARAAAEHPREGAALARDALRESLARPGEILGARM